MKIFIAGLLMLSSVTFASTSYDLNCVNNDVYTDLGTGQLELKTVLTVNQFNDYSIEGGFFKFFIEDAWTDQNVEVVKVNNYAKYRPRVYKNHAKFPNIGKNFFGIADFIVPHKDLLSGTEKFDGVFILSWIEDHWGGTTSAECTLKLKK